ncbi:hypothetical protein K1719_025879 [Acacia pycnantha]|nr:hypothetical protein K1719_025879 [Acacia pycnantha]
MRLVLKNIVLRNMKLFQHTLVWVLVTLQLRILCTQMDISCFTNIIHNIHVQTTRGGFKIDFLGLILILLVADDCWSIATRNSKAN